MKNKTKENVKSLKATAKKVVGTALNIYIFGSGALFTVATKKIIGFCEEVKDEYNNSLELIASMKKKES